MKIITAWIWLMSVIHVYGYKACETRSGKCKFPFTYHGTTYNICTQYNTEHKRRPWCYLVYGSYEYCLDECFECGVSNTVQKSCNIQNLGQEGAFSNDDFPWHVHIKDKNTNKILCNGAIISNNRVLTTVNCVKQIRSQGITELHAGSSTSDPYNGYQKGEIQNYNTHSDYNNETRENDIAIINLSNWLTWNDKVLPICISQDYFPANNSQRATFTGSRIVANFDEMKSIHYSVVHKVPNFVDRTDCERNGTFCTSKNSVDDNHIENEGGPLTIFQDSKCVLVGILSKIKHDKNILVFTNISKYMEWIMKFMN